MTARRHPGALSDAAGFAGEPRRPVPWFGLAKAVPDDRGPP